MIEGINLIEIPGVTKSGDTFDGWETQLSYIDDEGNTIYADLSQCDINIVFKGTQNKNFEISKGKGISVANEGIFTIDKILRFNYPPGTYVGDVVINYPDGSQYTKMIFSFNVI